MIQPSPLVGHEEVCAELERDLPPVTLLMGPRSVGKATMARYLAVRHSDGPWGVTCYERLTAVVAREIVQTAPLLRQGLHVRVIDLDNSSETAQNILLKVLEEPPAHCRFILVASAMVLTTVASRCRVYRLSLLTDEQVARVLERNGTASGMAAVQAAARGRGQVEPAARAVEDKDSARVTSVVAAAVRGASDGNRAVVDMALRNWTPEHTRVLEQWATERASGRWTYFTADLAPAATREGAMRVLFTLSTYHDSRTAPAVALDAMKERR